MVSFALIQCVHMYVHTLGRPPTQLPLLLDPWRVMGI